MTHTRNLGKPSDTYGPDVVLQARGRAARFNSNSGRIIAEVSMGYAKEPGYQGQVYRHPTLTLRTVDRDGSTFSSSFEITLRFQTHRIGIVESTRNDPAGPRGFLAFPMRWIGCYGAEIKAKHENFLDTKRLTCAMRLIDRARKSAPYERKCRGCDLLQLIIGLQRCGVEIRIWNEWLNKARAQRRPMQLAA